MSTEDPLKNWQLEDRKQQDPEQWKLEDAEQDLDKHLQLQSGETEAYWQPVEYERAAAPRRNWVLPSVLIVALLAVLGYVGWIAFGQLGGDIGALAGITGLAPTETPAVDAEVAAAVSPAPVDPITTLEPTATSAPVETPAPTVPAEPTVAMAELISGTVNAVAGVNARKEPSGELIRLLTENEAVTVTKQEGDWLQVILPDGVTVAWVAADFIDRTTQMVPLEQLASRYAAAGLPIPSAAADAGAITGTLDLATATPATGAGLLPTLALTGTAPVLVVNGVLPTAPFTNALPAIGPALTISDTVGVNARAADSTDGAVLTVVPNGAVLPVLGRNAAGDWLQVRLPDGQSAWMFAAAVLASPDAAAAPVVAGTAAPAAAVTATTPVTPTTPVLEGAPSGATATVANLLGANLRSAPTRDIDPVYSAQQGESFTLVGRSGDSQWVQVVLPDGASAWALTATVDLSVGVETLPVTQP